MDGTGWDNKEGGTANMHSRFARYLLAILALTALIGGLLAGGCGEDENGDGGNVTLVIGHITDLTGPASTALKPMTQGLTDLANYYNEHNLIPGVFLKVVDYDTQYDPSKDLLGWEYVKQKGAQFVICELPTTGDSIKNVAERDKIPVFGYATTDAQIDPPGWVFCQQPTGNYEMQTLLNWVSENDWDYSKGIPKVGGAGWNDPASISYQLGIRQYVEAHPDKFELGPLVTAPMGSMTWTSEVAALMDCDYVMPPCTSVSITTFMQQYLEAGGKTKWLFNGAHSAYMDMIPASLGWTALDGIPMILTYRYWGDVDSPMNDLAVELIETYHQAEATALKSGSGYLASFNGSWVAFGLIQKAAERVGPDKLNAQAIYDTAIDDLSVETLDGQVATWSATERTGIDYYCIERISAAKQGLERQGDWVPAL
jgi:hypothetical protein